MCIVDSAIEAILIELGWHEKAEAATASLLAERGNIMDMATLLPFLAQAVGGALGGNITGMLTRGGGGAVGRTIIGAIAGLGTAYAAQTFPALQGVTANWAELMPSDPAISAHLSNAITGAAGGGIVGLVTGLLIRSSNK